MKKNDPAHSDSQKSLLSMHQKSEVTKRLKLHKEGKLKYFTFDEIKKLIFRK